MKAFSEATHKEIEAMVAEYPNRKSMLMMVLRLCERDFGCIDDDAMKLTAEVCDVSPAHVLGSVTFYTHFKRPYHGTHRFMLCATLMCAIGGTPEALVQFKDKLNLEPGQRTYDKLFSLEKVECLADCDKPPVLQVDSAHHVNMVGKTLDLLLEDLLKSHGKSTEEYRKNPPVKMDTRVPFVPAITGNIPNPMDAFANGKNGANKGVNHG